MRRFEYLIAFICAKREGLSEGQIMEKVAELKRDFEVEKHRAIGRGKPFSKTIRVSESLVEECEKLASMSGLIDKKEGKLSPLGDKVAQFGDSEEGRRFLGHILLESLPPFARAIVELSRLPNTEIVVPQQRNLRLFLEYLSKSEIRLSQFDFEIVRDWATQLEISNWLTEEKTDKRLSTVYLCSKVDNSAEGGGDLVFRFEGSEYSITFNFVDPPEFKTVLWEEYLKLAKFVPRKPVFYSRLRASVCYRLRVSDAFFDRTIAKLIGHDEELLVVGSSGVLPRDKDWTSTLKYLPPKTERGEYIVYLRLDKR